MNQPCTPLHITRECRVRQLLSAHVSYTYVRRGDFSSLPEFDGVPLSRRRTVLCYCDRRSAKYVAS
jgi:hypothetical protein